MKKYILSLLLCSTACSAFANNEKTTSAPMWTPPKAACDAYNADKKASQGTSASRLTSTHHDEARETRGRDVVMPILCNPPMKHLRV